MRLFGKKQTFDERMRLIVATVRNVMANRDWQELTQEEYAKQATEACGHRRDQQTFVHAMYFQKDGKILAVSPVIMNDKNAFFGFHEFALGRSPKVAIPGCEVAVLTNHYDFWHGPLPYTFEEDVHLVNFARPQKGEEVSAGDVIFALSAYLTARGY